jgi:hypothetical protein
MEPHAKDDDPVVLPFALQSSGILAIILIPWQFALTQLGIAWIRRTTPFFGLGIGWSMGVAGIVLLILPSIIGMGLSAHALMNPERHGAKYPVFYIAIFTFLAHLSWCVCHAVLLRPVPVGIWISFL